MSAIGMILVANENPPPRHARAMMPADDPTPRRIITVAEIAEYLNVHRNTIYRLVGKGQIPFFRIGIDYRFDRDVIDKWMTDRTSEALKKSGAAVRAAPKKTEMAFARIPANPSEGSAPP